jgi:hypothetical protein
VSFTDPVNNLTFTSEGDDSSGLNVFVTVTTTSGTFGFTGFSDGVVGTKDLQDLTGFANVIGLVITNSDPAGLAYDDFTFDAKGVPEPAVWALMLAGFGVAGLGLRARRARTALS